MLSTHAHTDTQNTDLSGGGNGVIIQSPHTEAFSSLILRIHHIWYEGASGICPLFAFVTDVSSHLHPHLLKKKKFLPSQPAPCKASGEGEPCCSRRAALREPIHLQTDRDKRE